MKKKDISKDPAMIELERMIEAGELDPDRAEGYARKQADKPHESSGKPVATVPADQDGG